MGKFPNFSITGVPPLCNKGNKYSHAPPMMGTLRNELLGDSVVR